MVVKYCPECKEELELESYVDVGKPTQYKCKYCGNFVTKRKVYTTEAKSI